MSEQLYREATDRERRDHPDVEMLAVLPVEPDNEAATKAMHEGIPILDPDEVSDWIVDAALKGTDE